MVRLWCCGAYGKLPIQHSQHRGMFSSSLETLPTLELASVKLRHSGLDYAAEQVRTAYLLSVVDLPDDGFPTKPMRGSRGIAGSEQGHDGRLLCLRGHTTLPAFGGGINGRP